MNMFIHVHVHVGTLTVGHTVRVHAGCSRNASYMSVA